MMLSRNHHTGPRAVSGPEVICAACHHTCEIQATVQVEQRPLSNFGVFDPSLHASRAAALQSLLLVLSHASTILSRLSLTPFSTCPRPKLHEGHRSR